MSGASLEPSEITSLTSTNHRALEYEGMRSSTNVEVPQPCWLWYLKTSSFVSFDLEMILSALKATDFFLSVLATQQTIKGRVNFQLT